ncbi:MAG: DUF2029 domain-containing protein [Roseibium sp.]|nr:DUF2029 domain-containing protein [Roseibium sp.]
MDVRQVRLITAERARAASHIAPFAYLIAVAVMYGLLDHYRSATGSTLVNDFICFWLAGHEALTGGAGAIYDNTAFRAVQHPFLGEDAFFPFMYPPTFLLLVMPLGVLSFASAYIVFMGLSLAACALAGRVIWGSWQGAFIVLSLPAVFNVLVHGQNSLLACALLGAGLICLQNRQMVWAGIFIGLLSFKPQFGILIPLVLIAGRYWTAFITAAVVTLGFAGLSWAVLGTEVWVAFLAQTEFARSLLVNDFVAMYKYNTVTAALRMIGMPAGAALAVQAVVGLVLAVLTVRVWLSNAAFEAKAAVLVSASLLATPYVLSYDLVFLALPLIFILKLASERGFKRYDQWALLAVVVLSASTRFLGSATDLPVGPLPILLMLWVSLRHTDLFGRNHAPDATVTRSGAPAVHGG